MGLGAYASSPFFLPRDCHDRDRTAERLECNSGSLRLAQPVPTDCVAVGPQDSRLRSPDPRPVQQCAAFPRQPVWRGASGGPLNRQGQRQEFPLLSLSVGVVHLHPKACHTLDASQLAELASQAKHHAKEVIGASVHVIDTLEAEVMGGAGSGDFG